MTDYSKEQNDFFFIIKEIIVPFSSFYSEEKDLEKKEEFKEILKKEFL